MAKQATYLCRVFGLSQEGPIGGVLTQDFNLFKDKGHGMADASLIMLSIITLVERTALVLRVKHPKRHL